MRCRSVAKLPRKIRTPAKNRSKLNAAGEVQTKMEWIDIIPRHTLRCGCRHILAVPELPELVVAKTLQHIRVK
jgi:hypothetical protein